MKWKKLIRGHLLSEGVKGYAARMSWRTKVLRHLIMIVFLTLVGTSFVFVCQTEPRLCFLFMRLTNSLLCLWLTRWWSTRGTATGSMAGDTTSSNPLPRKDIPQIYLVSKLHLFPHYAKTLCTHSLSPHLHVNGSFQSGKWCLCKLISAPF